MNFNSYQESTKETAIYPGKGTLIGLMYVGLGLGESGEVQGKIKKILRDDQTASPPYNPERVEQIKGELGDTLWYIANAATELGLTLEDIASSNLEKLNSRKERGVLGGSGDNR